MSQITINRLNKHYGTAHHAVRDLDLTIGDKEFVALVGPSGCGKSTTLRMIAGLEDISDGEIRIGDRVVNDLPPRDRDIAMVFQSYALYQHMTVYDNLAFGLRNRKLPEDPIKAEIDRVTGILGLDALLQRRPKQLSGGQQQRVALGRCIVRNPKVFLFDEPLSNLDAKLRSQMRLEIKRLRLRVPTTSVFVTHDQVEAMTVGDRVVIMKDGRIQQAGTPLEVYGRPANKFVAGFIGAPAMNFVPVTLSEEAGTLYAVAPSVRLRLAPAHQQVLQAWRDRSVILGVRPGPAGAVLHRPPLLPLPGRVRGLEQPAQPMEQRRRRLPRLPAAGRFGALRAEHPRQASGRGPYRGALPRRLLLPARV